MNNITMKAKDTICAALAECFVTINGRQIGRASCRERVSA